MCFVRNSNDCSFKKNLAKQVVRSLLEKKKESKKETKAIYFVLNFELHKLKIGKHNNQRKK